MTSSSLAAPNSPARPAPQPSCVALSVGGEDREGVTSDLALLCRSRQSKAVAIAFVLPCSTITRMGLDVPTAAS